MGSRSIGVGMRVFAVTATVLLGIGISTLVLRPHEFDQRMLSLLLGMALGVGILRLASMFPTDEPASTPLPGPLEPLQPLPGPLEPPVEITARSQDNEPG